jgi:hypothetical protein
MLGDGTPLKRIAQSPAPRFDRRLGLRENGAKLIAWLRKEKPVEYFKLILSLLPPETEAERAPFYDVADDELREILEACRASLRSDAGEASSATGAPAATL